MSVTLSPSMSHVNQALIPFNLPSEVTFMFILKLALVLLIRTCSLNFILQICFDSDSCII